MSTYNQLIHKYKKQLDDKGLSLETAKAFLFELCNENNVDLYMNIDNEVLEVIDNRFNEGMARILNDEPMNYVLGYSYFYGYKLKVSNGCLIPRYETEELVGKILAYYDEYFKDKKVKVADIGTGSGAIAIALKKEEPKMDMVASDISLDALKIAKENAEINDADIEFLQGSMLEPLIEKGIKLDILVSNPPYIKADEVLENSVKDYEPHVALFGGDDGLKFYRMIFENANKVIKDKALLFFEIGYDQKENLAKLASSYFKDAQIEVFKDINNKDRMLMIKTF